MRHVSSQVLLKLTKTPFPSLEAWTSAAGRVVGGKGVPPDVEAVVDLERPVDIRILDKEVAVLVRGGGL